jgi:hypothetical protein
MDVPASWTIRGGRRESTGTPTTTSGTARVSCTVDDEPLCRFTLTRPPSTNALYANVPGKGRVKTRRYREWITAAGWEMRAQGIHPLGFGATNGRVRQVLIENVGRVDVDNIKAIPDLLTRMGLIIDDKMIDRLIVDRAGTGDKVTVSIWGA